MGSAPSIASIDGMLDRTIIADGFSKTFSMTGWRLGYMIAPPKLAERLELLVTHSTGPRRSLRNMPVWKPSRSAGFVQEMVSEYQKRRDRLVELVNAIPGVHAQKPQGAFYVFPN